MTLLSAWALRALFLWFKPEDAVANDAVYWSRVARLLLEGHNPYTHSNLLNWPPLWMVVVYGLGRLAEHVGDFFPGLWGLLLVAESGLIIATFGLLRAVAPRARGAVLLPAIALNPFAIFQVCQHGNFDVLMSLCIVLALTAVAAFARRDDPLSWLSACAWLGLGVLTKAVPVLLAPLLFSRARSLPARAWALGAVMLLGPAVLGVAVVYVLAPEGVWTNVIQYRSIGGWHGIPGLLRLAGADAAVSLHQRAFAPLLLASMAAAAAVLWRRPVSDPRRLVLLAALGLLAVATLGPGYGAQYGYWYLPLLTVCYAAFPDRRWRVLLASSAVVLAATSLFEYGLLQDSGALLVRLTGSHEMASLSADWSTPAATTIARLPLFLAQLLVLAGGMVLLVRSGATPAGPSPER